MARHTRTPAPGSFEFVEKLIRALDTEKAQGDAFEQLCWEFLRNEPRFRLLLKHVWLWNDWPDRWGPDKGIDLVAQTTDGLLWAIQAKAIHHDRSIPKRELDSFLSESNRPEFAYRLVIATTDDVGRNARHTLDGQVIPVGLVLRGDLIRAELTWPARIGRRSKLPARKRPRPHQRQAIRDVMNGFLEHGRGQLIMACGTGKTLTALWIAERLECLRTLVLVPSLSLISQTFAEWSLNAKRHFDVLLVCSDETVTQRREDHAITSTSELGVPVTTDVKEIRRFLGRSQTRPTVVFCTYQSSDRIAAAQRGRTPRFDLVLADEAHRCTGHAAGRFATVLDDSKIKADCRLFMTATPRYFTGRVKKRAGELDFELASMDDKAQFGPEFHRLNFNESIEQDLLTDYQVVVIGVTDAEARKWAEQARLVRGDGGFVSDARTLAAQIGLAKAMRKHKLAKIITFHSSVAKAKRFTDEKAADSLPSVIDGMSRASRPRGKLWTGHISGHTPAGKRATLLNLFGTLPGGSPGVVSNCACLGEGVDVPVLDGVAFIDPKRSTVDIIQAVGRVLRRAENKSVGTIVIPVFVDESEDAAQALSSSAFEPVWRVLRALRAHDTKLADELDELRLKLDQRRPFGGKVKLPAKVKLDVPTLLLRDFEQAFYARTVKSTTRLQFRPFLVARRFAHTLGLKSQAEWYQYCKNERPGQEPKPVDIPSDPYSTYECGGWVSWGDWLGTGTTWGLLKEFRPFHDARRFVHKLGLKGQREWSHYCRNKLPGHEPKPADIPSTPSRTYKGSGWAGMGDWLGTGKEFRPFHDARRFVHKLGLTGAAEWYQYRKNERPGQEPKPADIPSLPSGTYKDTGWVSWGDWFGTGTVAPQHREFCPFRDARGFVHKLGLKNCAEWYQYCKNERPGQEPKPADIPSFPAGTYKGSGWVGWGDWLGTGTVALQHRKFRPFRDARRFVQKLGLKSRVEWNQYRKNERPGQEPKPADIPSLPSGTYKDTGWASWGDWLGTGRRAYRRTVVAAPPKSHSSRRRS